VNRKALEAEAALASFILVANLYESDMRTLQNALRILREEAAK
jgi:hypothetical protein